MADELLQEGRQLHRLVFVGFWQIDVLEENNLPGAFLGPQYFAGPGRPFRADLV